MNRARVMIAFTLLAVLGPVAGAQAADDPMRAAAQRSAAEPIITFVVKDRCTPTAKRLSCKLKARYDRNAGYDYLGFFGGSRKAPDESVLLSGILHVKSKKCWLAWNEPYEVASRTRRMVRNLAKWLRGGTTRKAGSVLHWRKGADRVSFRLDEARRITTVISRRKDGYYRMSLRYPAAITRVTPTPACAAPSGPR